MLSITEETLKPVFDKIDSFFIEVHSTIPSHKHDYEWWDSIIINRVKLQEIFLIRTVGTKFRYLI